MLDLKWEDATDEQRRLYETALGVSEKSYAPYSNLKVGAAVLNFSGQIFSGCNVENGSFGLTMCAERVAIGSMVKATGFKRIRALCCVLEGGNAECSPCGACRQVIWEFCKGDGSVQILIGDLRHNIRLTTIGELLPYAFELTH